MNARVCISLSLTAVMVLLSFGAALAQRGGGFRAGGAGGARAGGGGFDMHSEAPTSHSSTGPAGTSRTTTTSGGAGNYSRNTTATNGNYSRTSGGSASEGGNVSHYSNGSSPYGSHSSSTSGNVQTGNYSHSGTGSNAYGSYSTSGAGNKYNHTYNGSGTATNAWGQTYTSRTYANNGVVYHGAAVTNPVYARYPAWGWNGGTTWYAAPYYWGGGFWGPFAVGAATAVAYGSIAANNVTYTSYEVQPTSAGAKLLEAYHLTQTQCGPSGLVVIYGPNNGVICARPNDLVAAGNYSVNVSTLTLVSENK
jgi:hypothetical protein